MKSLHKRVLTPGTRVLLIIFCVLLNVVGRLLSSGLQLPVWLDTIGSSVAVCSLGMGGAFLVCIFSILLLGGNVAGVVAYGTTCLVVVLFQNICWKKIPPKNFFKSLKMGFLTGIFSLMMVVPVYILLADGRSTNMWGNAFYSMLEWNDVSPVVCSILGTAVVEILDKQVCALCAFSLLYLFYNRPRKNAGESVKRGNVAIILACLVAGSWNLAELTVQAANGDEKYVSTIYDNSSGLYSSEANDIAETEDGYIWIGSYAGLTRYDGKEFEFIKEGGMVSITAMLTDSKGNLWIGTNGGKVVLYSEKSFRSFDLADDKNMNSVRCFAEDGEGNIFVGTTGDICKIENDGNLYFLKTGINYVASMVACEDGIIGCSYDGELFLMQDGVVKDWLAKDNPGEYYTCVSKTSEGILVGTSVQQIEMVRIIDGKIHMDGYRIVHPLSGICDLLEDSTGKLWVAADNGCGYIGTNGLQMISMQDFDGSVESIHEDYEGNIWLASTRYGVMKLSRSSFGELFSENGISSKTVNSICLFEGYFYCGTDSGLVIVDRENKKEITNELTTLLEGIRIRCVKADSKGNLWICTYSDKGLVRYSADGSIVTFTEQKSGTTSNRFRSVIELADGTIVAGASNGLNFIQGVKVVKTLSQEDGLENPQILCMLELEDGSFYAGTDGAGIYIIKGEEIVGHIGKSEGLSSQVVMRITPYKDGFFVVSGTSLCYMKNNKVTTLSEFPYYNNYDAFVMGEQLCVLASAGIYLVNAEPLISGESVICKLYNYHNGLVDGLTSNAWNYVDEEGTLYFATNRGVYYCNPLYWTINHTKYKFGLASVMYDGMIADETDGVYHIPAYAETIILEGSLRNYLCTNVKLRLFIKEITASPKTVNHSELEILQISNLRHGEYTICMQIMSDDETVVLQEQTYKLVKEAHIWENTWYKAYLIALGLWLTVFILWIFVDIRQGAEREKELEKIKYQAKGEFLTNMSHEFRTPVNTILGMNEMIMQESPDERIVECSDNIKQASERLLNLINDVLDYSAIESGKLEMIEENYPLENIINTAVFYMKSEAAKKGVETEYNVEDNLPARLLGDESRVKQVIINLLSNAVKYTEEGQIVLSVGGRVEKDIYFLTITVADTGVGISEKNQEKIFAEFDRLEFDKDRRVEGTGLGLSIANSLARQMGGNIALQSVEGSGSVFIVTIPQRIVGNKRIGIYSYAPEAEKEQTVMSFTAPDARVLAVDDNRMNLSVISGLLKRNGISPDVAFGGEEALELCKKNKYDLIFMDHMMPYPDGIETLHRIRKGKDVNKETPIVVLTANAVSGARTRYLEEGFDEYLSKPVDVNRLEAVLLRYLPMEMQILREAQAQEAKEAEEELDDNEVIVRTVGLHYCGGSEELYADILQTFHMEGTKYQAKLEEYFKQKNWKDYAITAHALKSTSLGIGASSLSKMAQKLELLAKAEDETKVAENHESFLDKISQVLEAIDKIHVLPAPEELLEAISDTEFLSQLRKLKEYIENYEMVKAIECITYLKQVTKDEETRAVLQQMEEEVNEFNYADAEDALKSLIKDYEGK